MTYQVDKKSLATHGRTKFHIFDKRTPTLGGREVKVGILRRDRSVGRGSGGQRCSMAVVRRQANSSQLKSGEAGQRWFEYDVPAIFDLADGIDARQLDLLALLGREFRAEDEGPVVEPLANDVGAELV